MVVVWLEFPVGLMTVDTNVMIITVATKKLPKMVIIG